MPTRVQTRSTSHRRRLGGIPAFDLDLDLVVFTPGMAKRAGGVFAAAPIIQGKWDGTGTPDVLSLVRGNLIGNQAGVWYDNFDPYQGGGFADWTPEQATGARTGDAYVWYASSAYYLKYDYSNDRYELTLGGQTMTVAAVLVAGTMEILSWGFDTKGSLDGANHTFFSRNNAQTFGMTTQPTATAPSATIHVGSNGTGGPSNAIPEGLVFVREIPWTGTYGTDMGVGDVVAAHYAAGSGADVALTIASWGTTFSLPTDSTLGALVTGEGEAWSHPHSSSEPKHSWLADGGYFVEPYAVKFNGVDTAGNCGSGATLDDLPAGDFTVNVWCRPDSAGGSGLGGLIGKLSGSLGWGLRLDQNYGVDSFAYHAGAMARSRLSLNVDFADGKWHLFTLFFNQTGDQKFYIAVDGKWATSYSVQTAGGGAYVSDAALDLLIGSVSVLETDGAIGLVTIWNDDHFNHGTDFIPPRAPESLPDATVVEQWDFDEGTGNTAAAHVTTPANDCALTNHVWEEQWDVEGTPVIPQSVTMVSGATINFGSGGNIDNLPQSANGMTLEYWYKRRAPASGDGILGKGSNFMLYTTASGLRIILRYDATDINFFLSAAALADSRHHHIAVTYNENGDRKARVWVDGLLRGTSAASVGNYDGDAADSFILQSLDGAIGQLRLSNTVRYTDTFVPPDRTTPIGNDANAHLLVPMTDGAGTTATDGSGNAYSGTIANGVWNNTPDMETDEPGARVFGWGYNLGSDGANDGMTQIDTGLTPGDDYVLRVPISVGQSGRAQAAIRIYDEIGAAIISTLAGPKYYGTHDGGNAAADLGDTTARWWQGFVGWTCHNIEDGSSCTITAVDGDMNGMTTPLAGGGSDDWQNGEHYLLRPPNGDAYSKHPWTETFCIELPAGCTSVSWKVLNPAGEGVLQVHQVEVQESLLPTGSMEAGAGDPWIPTGWTNAVLDAGDTEAEAGTVHSGAGSMEWNPGAIAGESIYLRPVLSAGDFMAFGGWFYEDGAVGLEFGFSQVTDGLLQHSTSLCRVDTLAIAAWSCVGCVARVVAANPYFVVAGVSGAVADRFSDDVYGIALDAVSLTVIPASEANSAESGGLRVDGRDTLAQPLTDIKSTRGRVRWRWTPRHGDTIFQGFSEGSDPLLLYISKDANNYVYVSESGASQITLGFDAGGAGLQTGVWNVGAGEIVADTEYLLEVRYTASKIEFLVDGVVMITVNQPTGFDWAGGTAYWGSDATGANQSDAVYAVP